MTQEQIVDNIILDELELKHPGSKELILSKTTKSGRRIAMLSIMDDDRKLFEQFKNIIKSEEVCGNYAKEVVQILRKYVKVADTEVKEHGEVMTSLTLVDEMLDKLPSEVWVNPNLKWLDPCNGVGTFPSVVVERLMIGLKDVIIDDCERYRHIIEKMIYVCEIQAKNMLIFHCSFDREDDHELNTYYGSFLDKGFDEHMLNVWGVDKFDIVLGNPPYKNGTHHKFIVKGFNLLNEGGSVLILHPSTAFVNKKNVSKDNVEHNLIEIVNTNKTTLIFLRASDYFNDIFLYVPLSITLILKSNSNEILLDNKFIENHITQTLNNVNEIYIHGTPLIFSILNKINSKHLPNVYDSLFPNKNGGVFIKLPRFSGHKPIKDKLNPDFFTIIIKKYENDFNGMIVNGMSNDLDILLPLSTDTNCINYINYLMTKFARFSLSINKINQNLAHKEYQSIPMVDENILWTDEMLFDYFELTEEERNYINTFIPNYYQRDFQNN
jgi:site-specific DNA-methyltransferase (adenine-specific)